MKKLIPFLFLLLAFASPAWAQIVPDPRDGAGSAAGSPITGCTAYSIVTINAAGNLTCAPTTVVNGSVSTAARSILSISDTITGDSATSNWFNLTGTLPAVLSATTSGAYISVTGNSQAFEQDSLYVEQNPGAGSISPSAIFGVMNSGYSGNQSSFAIRAQNNSIGAGAIDWAIGGLSSNNAASTLSGGVVGQATANNANATWVQGASFLAGGAATPVTNVGVSGLSYSGATNSIGGLFGLASNINMSIFTNSLSTYLVTTGKAALVADNDTVAANIFEARDNGVAVVTIADAGVMTHGSVTTAARATQIWNDTMTGSSATSNWYNLTGTFPGTLSAETSGVNIVVVGDNDAQAQNAVKIAYTANVANYTSGAISVVSTGTVGGTNAYFKNDNDVASVTTYGSVSVADNNTGGNVREVGSWSEAVGSALTNLAIGAMGISNAPSNRTVGIWGEANSGASTSIGVYGLLQATTTALGALPSNPAVVKAAGLFNNGSVAASSLCAQDNGAAEPTTAATATWCVKDGGLPQYGGGVLTTSTMTATTQAIQATSTHSYAWTNAMVTALGAVLVGDITVATLPAKTQIDNAYVVIDTAAGGPTTLTVSCGDAIGGAPFINYTVASDAKAAANTLYGDAVAERGTAIDVEFYYVPSYTATTLVTCRFTATVTNLNTTTTSTGRVILTTTLLP